MTWFTVIWYGLDQARHTWEVCADSECDAVAQALRHFPHAMSARVVH